MERTIERREQNLAKKNPHTHTHKQIHRTDSVLELEEKGKCSRPIRAFDRNIHIQMGTGSHRLKSVHLMLKEM